MPIRLLIADDERLFRQSLRILLETGTDIKVVAEAANGHEAVAFARATEPDLAVLDVDMPRMDGIELVTLINKDANLKSVPVIIVSYKDRDEDRQRGLEAGAAYYLTKGSFHDETLLQAVVDLIGEPDA